MFPFYLPLSLSFTSSQRIFSKQESRAMKRLWESPLLIFILSRWEVTNWLNKCFNWPHKVFLYNLNEHTQYVKSKRFHTRIHIPCQSLNNVGRFSAYCYYSVAYTKPTLLKIATVIFFKITWLICLRHDKMRIWNLYRRIKWK